MWAAASCRRIVEMPPAVMHRYLAAAVGPLLLLLWPWGAVTGAHATASAHGTLAPVAITAPAVVATPPSAATTPASTASRLPAAIMAPDRTRLTTSQTSAAAMQSTAPLVVTYTVQNGDNLSTIAQRFGTDVPSLEKTNNLNDSSVLQPGQKLTVLREVGWLYTVGSGDTLSGIASTSGTTVAQLEQANHLTGSAPLLQVGEQLIIPKDPTVAQPASGPSSEGSSSAPAPVAIASASHSGLLIWPVHGVITSPFGWRPDPWTNRGSFFHHGIDIGVPMWTPVAAACSGVVHLASWDGGYGRAVEIDCDDGLLTLYAHNSELKVTVGERVAVGDLISYSGMTGNATGPHVHFGVMSNGVWQNPMNDLPPQ